MPSILELSHTEARSYFMEEKNYVSFDLPPYFTFQDLLNKTSAKIGNSQISSFFRHVPATASKPAHILDPKRIDGVNYKLLASKDGEFAWRPFEIIHPALYVSLVNEICGDSSWYEILSAFNRFSTSCVTCESIPFQSEDEESHKAKQINRWWTNVEQTSIKQGLKYQYVVDADISDCYGSIYTHSIAWALHGKEIMKTNTTSSDYLGNRIDWLIQKMRHGQTNGIPQGSALMDFIAEILLGYIDIMLTERLKTIHPDSFKIIRYRDDYRIFTNDPDKGRQILKELSQLLSEFGMKLNTNKTKVHSDPILASIKTDKMYELLLPKNSLSLSKKLLAIYGAVNQHCNSGMAARLLNDYLKIIEKTKRLGKFDDPVAMISIVVNIAIKNPRTHPHCMAIISHLLSHCPIETKAEILNDIIQKFSRIPNTGLLDIWLQRITYPLDPTYTFDERLTKIASGDIATNLIWTSGWINGALLEIVSGTSIIDRTKLQAISPLVPATEVTLFSLES